MTDSLSIIIPAYNEAAVLGRLLDRLLPATTDQPGFEIIVAANGCTDSTAELAASYGPAVRVLDLPAPGKRAALDAGDQAACTFPRIYIDADVEIGAADVLALGRALRQPGVLAAGPQRYLPLAGRPWLVRWYYQVWTRLPHVQDGLFGRGVVGVSEQGHDRIAHLPPVLGDDLAASLAFAEHERVIVLEAQVTIHPPRTIADLVRRRVRSAVVVTEAEEAYGEHGKSERTSRADLVAIARSDLAMVPRVAAFATLAVVARTLARRTIRRRDFTTWLRDDSSRQAG